jgi:hypothetical protein
MLSSPWTITNTNRRCNRWISNGTQPGTDYNGTLMTDTAPVTTRSRSRYGWATHLRNHIQLRCTPDITIRSNTSNTIARTTIAIDQTPTMLSKATFTALLLLWNTAEAQSLTPSPSQNATEITSVTTSEDSTVTGTSLTCKCRHPSIIAR